MTIETFLKEYAEKRYLPPKDDEPSYLLDIISQNPVELGQDEDEKKWYCFNGKESKKIPFSDEFCTSSEIIIKFLISIFDKIAIVKEEEEEEKGLELLTELFENNFVIAGGLIARLIMKQDIKNSDIDIFYCGKEKNPDELFVKILKKYIPEETLICRVSTTNAITFTFYVDGGDNILKLQLITYIYVSLLHVLNSFDIGLSCVGCDGSAIKLNKFALISYRYGGVFYHDKLYNPNYRYRICKYYGFCHRMFIYEFNITSSYLLDIIPNGNDYIKLGEDLFIKYTNYCPSYIRCTKKLKHEKKYTGDALYYRCEINETIDDSSEVITHATAFYLVETISKGFCPIKVFKGFDGDKVHPNFIGILIDIANTYFHINIKKNWNIPNFKTLIKKLKKEELVNLLDEDKKGNIMINYDALKVILDEKYMSVIRFLEELKENRIEIKFRSVEKVLSKTKQEKKIFYPKYFE